jgi:hypothetical protein
MNKHYIVKVGNLFVENSWVSIGGLQLTDKKNNAKRFEKDEMAKITSHLRSNNITYEIIEVTTTEMMVEWSEAEKQ